jgi:glutamate N-acetyltransferase / amino-acid N-acetyltransferase
MADLRSITAPAGFRAAGGTCGIKASGRPDLALIAADRPCPAAAVFTTSAIPSPSVIVGRKHLKAGSLQAIVCNSGNANASTGVRGVKDAAAMCGAVAQHLRCKPTQVLACSTGIIGQPLTMGKILPGIDRLAATLDASARADAAAATAIMTTDLTTKMALRTAKLGGTSVTLGGIAKGSGMIAPNMATMLAFITTDAAITLRPLRWALQEAVNASASFNRISVDTDTSPSDTVAIMASGRAGHRSIAARGSLYAAFVEVLTDLCRDLAYQIIADGEGATKVIRVKVEGARSEADASRVGRAIAESPLVKTAVHGGDPNWGRLTMAIGKSGAAVKAEKLSVSIGPIEVYRHGRPAAADLPTLQMLMRHKEVVMTVRLGLGRASTTWLGCDLSREYIAINADYRT